ncbi:hypothetical protein [Oceanobacillus halotolerans]|uniref:hypothetical protein n=1 Tax=Oceanobacillus halotolerans TaxID=2663380 RepID=UPI0013DA2D65|nr:hypothetical protein [Oceanobacillus halotolerans]
MSIRKEDVYRFIEKMNEDDSKLAYKVLQSISQNTKNKRSEVIESDYGELNQGELTALADVIKEGTVD